MTNKGQRAGGPSAGCSLADGANTANASRAARFLMSRATRFPSSAIMTRSARRPSSVRPFVCPSVRPPVCPSVCLRAIRSSGVAMRRPAQIDTCSANTLASLGATNLLRRSHYLLKTCQPTIRWPQNSARTAGQLVLIWAPTRQRERESKLTPTELSSPKLAS